MRKVLKSAILVGMVVGIVAGCNGVIPGPIPAQDGTYDVGMKVDFGTYRTTSAGCSWHVYGTRERHGTGPTTLRLTDYDTAVKVVGCGRWTTVSH